MPAHKDLSPLTSSRIAKPNRTPRSQHCKFLVTDMPPRRQIRKNRRIDTLAAALESLSTDATTHQARLGVDSGAARRRCNAIQYIHSKQGRTSGAARKVIVSKTPRSAILKEA